MDWIPGEEITALPLKRNTHKIIRNISIAASVITLLGAGFFQFLTNHQKANRPVQLATVKPIKPISGRTMALQLTNGDSIDLSRMQDSILSCNIRLNNTGKELSYTVTLNDSSTCQGMNTLTVPATKNYKLSLSDGTTIMLNSGSRLQFPFTFSAHTREVNIDGEAHMKVAKDTGRPFLVHTKGGTVEVLGTEFNINSYDSGMVKVSLVEGAIKFENAGEAVTIKPGEEAVYNEMNKKISTRPFDAEEVLAWQKGIYHFNDASLTQITIIIKRWFDIQVEIDNDALRKQSFSCEMDRTRPIEFFLENLKNTSAISYYFDKDSVLHIE